MKRILAVTGVISLALTLAACGEEDDTTTDTGTTTQTATEAATMEETTTEETTVAEEAGEDIVDTAVGAGSFNTLVAAVQAAGLEETLRGDGPFTVFAPTDEAFDALPEGTLDALLADPEGDLTEILTYHVVDGEVPAADVVEMDGQAVETLQGGSFTVELEGEAVVLVDAAGNRVNVTTTDVEASNGVIHVIDTVLSPTP
ncbi:Immunogenic protein MPT70 precursor [Corynebacterium faecale]|uniref:fasciclin domain-containing protein n=1 Tax=Corynebacterium faecale TaxID=1758466 RepID=UPI0025B2EE0D|nr:fasciclin domain-containing protein [Corynebacterium faecale]WJY90904.1 Immunogenic protein MPT70 precursor [Corynebacterium faecale]